MIEFAIISSIIQIITGSSAILYSFIKSFGYIAIFVLMMLEGISLPVPSEVIMPLAGYFSATGLLFLPFAIIAGSIGNLFGILIDYYIAYYLGKDIIYNNIEKIHIKRTTLNAFDRWFERNGNIVVFTTRMVPVIRTIVSFPAGFARMDIKKFILYSFAGSLIWDIILALFGYYALPSNNAILILLSTGIFIIALYIIYKLHSKSMKKSL